MIKLLIALSFLFTSPSLFASICNERKSERACGNTSCTWVGKSKPNKRTGKRAKAYCKSKGKRGEATSKKKSSKKKKAKKSKKSKASKKDKKKKSKANKESKKNKKAKKKKKSKKGKKKKKI